jgi:hypothetical protein
VKPLFLSVDQDGTATEVLAHMEAFIADSASITVPVIVSQAAAILSLPLNVTVEDMRANIGKVLAGEWKQPQEDGEDGEESDEESSAHDLVCMSLPPMNGFAAYTVLHDGSISTSNDDAKINLEPDFDPDVNLELKQPFLMGFTAVADMKNVSSSTSWSVTSDMFYADPADARQETDWGTASAADVVTLDSVITETECATLIQYLQDNMSTDADSVDGLPDYQADMPKPAFLELKKYLSTPAIETIWQALKTLPCGVEDERVQAGVDWQTTDAGIFLREYSVSSRQSIVFHEDVSHYTINIALNADSAYTGGDLVGIIDGEKQVIHRGAGSVSLHGPNVIHRVEKMQSGSRYSLILFLYNTKD